MNAKRLLRFSYLDELIRVSMEIGEQDYQWFSDVIPDSLLDAGI
jgi:hypothetical protein